MTDLKSYLAEKYMSGPKADAILARTTKKKKRKKAGGDDAEAQPVSSMIRDEDAGFGFGFDNKKYGEGEEEEVEEDEKAIIASDRKFKKRRKVAAAADAGGGWTTVVQPTKEETTPPPTADELPLVVEAEFTGGLVSASQFRKVLPTPAAANPDPTTSEDMALAQETVYRDSSGRKIDTKAAKAEAARLKRLREEKEAEKMEWGKGLVQRDDAEKRKKDLEKAAKSAFARHADDKELNEEQKNKELWNDPAAAFLTKKRNKGPRKPEYTGPAPPPNRFGIKPGYRWDGVDRGNGFEKKLYQSTNDRKRKDQQAYAWGVDDM